jgi:plastocyanin
VRLSVRRSLAALTIAALVLLTACAEATGPNGEKLVDVLDDVFSPMTKTIAADETVMWQWKGSNSHNVTFTDPSGTSNSPTQNTGTFTRKFSNAGTFNYYCTIHGTATTGMRGSIVVQ